LRPGVSALGAHGAGVAPRPEHPGTGLVQHHHERLRVWVEVKLAVGAPVRRGREFPEPRTLQDPPKPVLLGIEYPAAVTRIDGGNYPLTV